MRYNDTTKEVDAAVREELSPVDMYARYDEMLDEINAEYCQGCFKDARPSDFVRENDPVAYRCGFSDWLDGENVVEIDGEYYDGDEVEEIEERLAEEKE